MAEASKEGLDCKTLFLKVSIHCEGCKKKVKRVLQNMPAVSKVEIDSFQHKVAVTCNVDHETLIRKLQKSGKQASVWPETKKPGSNQTPPNTSNDNKNQNNESNSKPKDKEPDESSEKPKEIQPKQAKGKSSDKGDEKVKEKGREKPKTEDETKSKPQEKEKEKDKGKDVVKEKPKENEDKAKEQPEQEAKQNGSSESKKEKNEDKKQNESSGKVGGQHVERGISPPQPNQEFMNPYSYPYPPQPIMSYHTAQPSSSQAFYQQPPVPGMQGYMHPYQHPYPYPYQYPYGAPSEFNYGTTESSTRGHDTLNYFNDEDPNSCSVM